MAPTGRCGILSCRDDVQLAYFQTPSQGGGPEGNHVGTAGIVFEGVEEIAANGWTWGRIPIVMRTHAQRNSDFEPKAIEI